MEPPSTLAYSLNKLSLVPAIFDGRSVNRNSPKSIVAT